MLDSAEQEVFLLNNVKIPTGVGILIFMSKKIAFYVYLNQKKIAEFLDVFIPMSIYNFMLS